jgi:transposase
MKQLSDFNLGKIIALREQGLTYREIAEKIKRSITTISSVLKRNNERGHPFRKAGSGRPSALNNEHKKVLATIMKKEPKLSVCKMNAKLKDKTGVSICHETVRRELKKQGIFAYSPVKRPKLNENHKISRFNLCNKWSDEPEEYWEKVIFSDECKFNLHNSDGKTYVWRKQGTGLETRYLKETIKHGGGFVMVWGCISSKGIGRLVFIEGIMDSPYYKRILVNNLKRSATSMGLTDFIFQQDNDPKHTSELLREYFERQEIKLLEWPSQSPDLNPIEHVWAHMKRCLAGKSFGTRDELKAELKSIWNSISSEFTAKLVKSMPRRIESVLRARGGNTYY